MRSTLRRAWLAALVGLGLVGCRASYFADVTGSAGQRVAVVRIQLLQLGADYSKDTILQVGIWNESQEPFEVLLDETWVSTGVIESSPRRYREDSPVVQPGGFGSFKFWFPGGEVNSYHVFRHEVTVVVRQGDETLRLVHAVWRNKDDEFGR